MDTTVLLVLHEGVELLDFAGPGEVFAVTPGFCVTTVAPGGAAFTSQRFLRITPDHSFDDAPHADVLVLPGGDTHHLLNDPAAMRWLDRACTDATLVLSVCTGALVLAALGVLDGRPATTWHGRLDTLRARAPACDVREGVRYVDSGKIITTAGVSAGIDGALHVVRRLKGESAAADTARYMEYDGWPAEGLIV